MQVKKQFYFKTRYYIRNSQYIYFKTKTEHRYILGRRQYVAWSQFFFIHWIAVYRSMHTYCAVASVWMDRSPSIRSDRMSDLASIPLPPRDTDPGTTPATNHRRPPPGEPTTLHVPTYVRTHRKSLKIRTYSWWPLLA